jgi:radical SAM/Cys-rich protein
MEHDNETEWSGTPFSERLRESGLHPLISRSIEVLQINVGLACNLSCKHCHLAAGPHRTESMSGPVMAKCLEIARNPSITTIDITGGAPELNPNLPRFLEQASRLNKRLIVRSNLVILDDSLYRQFIDLYARYGVEIVGSLPDLHAAKTDRQRGVGIFEREIAVLRELNSRGYGVDGSALKLDLVHNPVGAILPASQKTIERDYRSRLLSEYGIRFSSLFCLTNNPIGRYREFLLNSGNYEDYMCALAGAYNPCAAGNVMCRSLLSVGWDGRLYDCDFNQALGLSVNHGTPDHIDRFDMAALTQREIVVGNHCYACTAGAGSSCQGATQ